MEVTTNARPYTFVTQQTSRTSDVSAATMTTTHAKEVLRLYLPPRDVKEVVLVCRNAQAGHDRPRRRHEAQHVGLEVERQLEVALPCDVGNCKIQRDDTRRIEAIKW